MGSLTQHPGMRWCQQRVHACNSDATEWTFFMDASQTLSSSCSGCAEARTASAAPPRFPVVPTLLRAAHSFAALVCSPINLPGANKEREERKKKKKKKLLCKALVRGCIEWKGCKRAVRCTFAALQRRQVRPLLRPFRVSV